MIADLEHCHQMEYQYVNNSKQVKHEEAVIIIITVGMSNERRKKSKMMLASKDRCGLLVFIFIG
jgi:hypothetical protein